MGETAAALAAGSIVFKSSSKCYTVFLPLNCCVECCFHTVCATLVDVKMFDNFATTSRLYKSYLNALKTNSAS